MLYQNFRTQAELDVQYDPTQSVSDFTRYIDSYIKDSALVRQELKCHLDISFGPSLAEYLDIFPAGTYSPTVVFIHGGYWHRFTSKEFSFVAKGLVSAGVTVVVINYALCPKVTLDEIVRQSRASIAWLYRNAKNFGSDPERIYVSGHSAGGHLVAMLMITDWKHDYGLPSNLIKGGCAISGLFDLTPFPYTWLQPSLQLTRDVVIRNSPIFHISKCTAPLIITHGSDESLEFERQSQAFLAAWKANGLKGKYFSLPSKNHFNAIDGFLSRNSLLCKAILRQIDVANS